MKGSTHILMRRGTRKEESNRTTTKGEKLCNASVRVELKSIDANIVGTVLKLKCTISRRTQNLVAMIECKRTLR